MIVFSSHDALPTARTVPPPTPLVLTRALSFAIWIGRVSKPASNRTKVLRGEAPPCARSCVPAPKFDAGLAALT